MPERLAVRAMGARFEIVLEGRDRAHARAAGEAALAEIVRCDERWSLFRSDSLIARVNRDAREAPVRLDAETYELLEACEALRRRTRGAFDVCVGASLRALGFRDRPASGRDVPAGALELDRTRRSVRLAGEHAALDLGAIAKGEALDLAAEALREAGVSRALLHGGTSSVLAIGAPPGADAWRVALDDLPAGRVIELRDASLSVSAPGGRTAVRDGATVGHVVDPSSGAPLAVRSSGAPLAVRSGGAPLAPGLRAVVRASSGRVAEAWSTAALVLAARGEDPRELLPAIEALFDWVLEARGERGVDQPYR